MKHIFLLISLLFYFFTAQNIYSQNWSWEFRSSMPSEISNNAVCGLRLNGDLKIFSFAGIDNSKIYSGISLSSFSYSFLNDNWDTIPPLPNGLTRIAAAASLVKGKIYIIGGYHVAQNGNESSLSLVHVFDPETKQYLPNGSNTLVPIDDHVQIVWRDSLIYLITGWSNTNNVSAVQVYNPQADSWSFANNLPDPNYRVFGASGVCIDDTIFYSGGAANWNGSTFPLTDQIRIGIIDPGNPLNILWQTSQDSQAIGYRMGSFVYRKKAHWVGGGQNSYNYDGNAYDGSGSVLPYNGIRYFNSQSASIATYNEALFGRMDIRGVASFPSSDTFFICGGMDSQTQVSNTTIQFNPSSVSQGFDYPTTSSYNIIYGREGVIIESKIGGAIECTIYDIDGRLFARRVFTGKCVFKKKEFQQRTILIFSLKNERDNSLELRKFIWL